MVHEYITVHKQFNLQHRHIYSVTHCLAAFSQWWQSQVVAKKDSLSHKDSNTFHLALCRTICWLLIYKKSCFTEILKTMCKIPETLKFRCIIDSVSPTQLLFHPALTQIVISYIEYQTLKEDVYLRTTHTMYMKNT